MKIKKIESTFPTPIGLTISGCKGNFYSGNGSRYAYVAGTNESTHNMDKIVATTNPYVNSEYLRLYPGMVCSIPIPELSLELFPNANTNCSCSQTAENLKSNGIMDVP